MRKVPKTRHIWKYWYHTAISNPSEETICGSNKIKEQHERIKLQNEEVILRNT